MTTPQQPGMLDGMRELARALNAMREAGIILNYALFGATAQMRYTEPVATVDADVLVAVPAPDRLDALAGIYEYCARMGHHPEGEAIRIGNWPAQFIPVYDDLTREALDRAECADFEGEPLRVLGADYLAAIALKTGRTKDHLRIIALLEAGSVTRDQIAQLASRHGLSGRWQHFSTRFLDE